jgi:hypothetical protein
MVLERGAQGYKLAVWDGDARVFLTDRVADRLIGTHHAGQGMGIMLQLGPKWLQLYGQAFAPKALRENVLAQLMLFGIKEPEQYPIRINRLDIALDVSGLDITSFSWMNGGGSGWICQAAQLSSVTPDRRPDRNHDWLSQGMCASQSMTK